MIISGNYLDVDVDSYFKQAFKTYFPTFNQSEFHERTEYVQIDGEIVGGFAVVTDRFYSFSVYGNFQRKLPKNTLCIAFIYAKSGYSGKEVIEHLGAEKTLEYDYIYVYASKGGYRSYKDTITKAFYDSEVLISTSTTPTFTSTK